MVNRHLNRVVLGMITIYAGIWFWLISRSWYQGDDFIYLWKTTQPGKLFETMFTPYVGHLLPGDFLLTWLTQRPARMNWEINAAVTAAGLVIAAILVWRVLRSLLGIRPLSIVLMTAYLTSGSIIVTSFWWAAAVEYIPLMIGVPLLILLFQRALTTPTWMNALLPTLTLIAMLFFFEKSLIYVPFIVALVAITPLFPGAAPSALGRLQQAIRPLVPLLLVAISYGLLYLGISSGESRRPEFSIALLGQITPAPAVSTLFPNLVGFDDPMSFVRLNTAQFLGTAVVLMLLVRTIVRYRAGLPHWLLLLGLIVVNIGLLVSATRRFPGADRYWSDLVFPMLLLIGLSQVGSRFAGRDQQGTTIDNETQPRRLRFFSWSVVGMIAFASVATFNLLDHPAQPAAVGAEAYVRNALASTANIDGPVDLLRQQVPRRVMSAILLKPFNTTRTVFEPSNGDFSFVESTTDPYVVLDSGEVVPARVKVIREAAGVDPDCASAEPGPSQRILDLGSKPVSPDSRIGQLDYRSDQASQLVISWDGRSVDIPIEPGSGTVTFSIEGGDWRRITISQPAGTVCITALDVGTFESR